MIRWRVVLSSLDETDGVERSEGEIRVSLPATAHAGGFTAECAAYLVNEVITQINDLLGPNEVAAQRVLPYLGTCSRCGRVVDDQHLLGGERDICDRCWRR